MSVTKDIKDDYIQRLVAGGLGIAVSEMPNNPKMYSLLDPVGEVLIQYTNSTFDEPERSNQNYPGAPTRKVPQLRRLHIQLTLVLRSLGGPNGTSEKLDQVRDCLKEFRPRHCNTQVFFLSDGFISEDQGIWQYGLNTAVELWEK